MEQLHIGNGACMVISHTGSNIVLCTTSNNQKCLLKDMMHIPLISKNLLSKSIFVHDNDVFFKFHASICFVKDLKTKEILLQGTLKQRLCILSFSIIIKSSSFTRNKSFILHCTSICCKWWFI